MIEDNIEVNVSNTIEVVDVFPQITEEVVDINISDNSEDVVINVTESIIEVNINKVTNVLSAVWGSITGTLSSQTDLQSALNAKQNSLSGTGFVKISGTTISYDNSTYYPYPTGLANQYVRGDGALATLPTSTGGGSSVNYYLNGGTAASVGGYYQMSNTAVIGTGVDFSLSSDGVIAQFLTDLGNPNRLVIPAGNWNFESYFSASSIGGSPSYYLSLYKYNGSTFTLIADSSAAPKPITSGTTIDLYISSLAVPETTLLSTDRLAVRVNIIASGKTITLHTQNSHLCQVITTFSTGIGALNGLTANTQYLAIGTSGTDANISSVTDTHTFNFPSASATNRGLLLSADWTTFNNKANALSGTINTLTYWASSTTIGSLALSTYPSLTEISYIKGLGSAVQTQINTKIGGSGTSGYVSKFNGTGTTITNSLIYDNGTNVGIGVTPSTWNVGKAVEFFYQGNSLWTYSQDNIYLLANAYFNGGFKYGGTGYSTNYTQYQGQHQWLTAPSGTAGNAISFTQAMTLDASGRLGIGTTAPQDKLVVIGPNGTAGLEFGNFSNTESYILNYNRSLSTYTGFRIITNSSNNTLVATPSGSVGIGTTSPAYKLDVNGAIRLQGNNKVYFDTTGESASNYIGITNDYWTTIACVRGNGSKIDLTNGTGIIFSEGGAERMRIQTTTGNVGIGTSSVGVKLVIGGATLAPTPILGSSTTGAHAILSLNGIYGLYTGVSNNGDVWQQVQRNDGFSDTYNLLLNPSGGSVGIGTTSPSYKLDVVGDGRFSGSVTASGLQAKGSTLNNNNSIKFLRADNNEMGYIGWSNENTSNSTWYFKSSNGNPIGFSADGVNQQVTIATSGNVGIATTSPTAKLHVVGNALFLNSGVTEVSIRTPNATFNNSYLSFGTDVYNRAQIMVTGASANTGDMAFSTFNSGTGSEVMRLKSSGSVGIGTTSPAQKLHVVGGIRGEYYSSVNNKGLNQIVDFIDLDNVRYQMTFEDGILVGYVVT